MNVVRIDIDGDADRVYADDLRLVPRDDLVRLLQTSLEVYRAADHGAPVRCVTCGVTFLGATAAIAHFRGHQR